MRIGNLRHPVTLERQSTGQDMAGQPLVIWSTIVRRMVSIEPLNGREYYAASGENSEVNTRIRIRYDERVQTVRPYDRVVDYTRSPAVVYDILSVINPRDRDRELIFMTQRRG